MKHARHTLVKLVVLGFAISANMLGVSAATARAAPGTARPAVHTIGPGTIVSMAHPPPAAPHQAAGILPFFPRNRAAYDQGKAQANRGAWAAAKDRRFTLFPEDRARLPRRTHPPR
jgi:hypothetical protein